MTESLGLNGVTKHYQRGREWVRALDGVNLAIPQGSFTAIVGPSGSGKSTCLYLMGCMDRPTNGEVRVLGETISAWEDGALARLRQRHLGFVFQQFFLMPSLTALENVQLPTLFSKHKADGRDLLALVGMEGRENHLPSELSGGEMQRVAIARALVNQPQVLLADEPTGNLDSDNAARIYDLFATLTRERGLTVVTVTHSAELAAKADQVVRLKDGKVAG